MRQRFQLPYDFTGIPYLDPHAIMPPIDKSKYNKAQFLFSLHQHLGCLAVLGFIVWFFYIFQVINIGLLNNCLNSILVFWFFGLLFIGWFILANKRKLDSLFLEVDDEFALADWQWYCENHMARQKGTILEGHEHLADIWIRRRI